MLFIDPTNDTRSEHIFQPQAPPASTLAGFSLSFLLWPAAAAAAEEQEEEEEAVADILQESLWDGLLGSLIASKKQVFVSLWPKKPARSAAIFRAN